MTTRQSLLLLNALAATWFLTVHVAWISPAARLWIALAFGVAALTAYGVAGTLVGMAGFQRFAKRWNWHRWHAWDTVERERRRHLATREELAKADTDLVAQRRTIAERDRTIAELSRDLNDAHAEIRALRPLAGRRKEDRA